MIRFGLYFIPEKSPLYDKGSKVLGYDIRSQETVGPYSYISPQWISDAKSFGLHATITDVVDVYEEELPIIEIKIENILSCFTKGAITLHKTKVGFWGVKSDQVAIRMTSNRKLEALHDVLVASIQAPGRGSVYLERFNANPTDYFRESKEMIQKTKLFCAPYIFDNFIPHFTLVDSFVGNDEDRAELEGRIIRVFSDFDEVKMSTVALVTKRSDQPFYRIRREFSLT